MGAPPVENSASSSGEGFPRSLRLRRRSEYRAVQGRGRKLHTPHLVVFALPTKDGEQRLGITASRKVGCAVIRNRLKRHVRETYRRHRDAFPSGQAVVVLIKRDMKQLKRSSLEAELLAAARRLGGGG
jgi:ribonuclease P protein component